MSGLPAHAGASVERSAEGGRRDHAERRTSAATSESAIVRALVIAVGLGFLGLVLAVPLVAVFASAFAKGVAPFLLALSDSYTLSAIELTLIAAALAVPLNLVFGIAAAWVVAKYEFWGRSALITLIDLPFSVSPVISGLIFVLLFGAQGWFRALARRARRGRDLRRARHRAPAELPRAAPAPASALGSVGL